MSEEEVETEKDIMIAGEPFSSVNAALLDAAYNGDFKAVKTAIKNHADVNVKHPENAMTALHLAIVQNQFEMTQFLLENGAEICADGFGRWPRSLAAHGRVSAELWDIVEAFDEHEEDESS